MAVRRITRGQAAAAPEVHRVTSAQEPLSQEQGRRTRRYLVSMSIRTVCFLAVLVTEGWMQWAAIAGAVFLPYLAVVAANAGRENDTFTNAPVPAPTERELPPGSARVIETAPGNPDQAPGSRA